jgi:hypothetical protein
MDSSAHRHRRERCRKAARVRGREQGAVSREKGVWKGKVKVKAAGEGCVRETVKGRAMGGAGGGAG